jgi:GAF domain-containing protein
LKAVAKEVALAVVNRSGQVFSPRDLGVLDGPPEKGFEVVVGLCAIALRAPKVALFMIDDENASLSLRASNGLDQSINPLIGLPLAGSIVSQIRTDNSPVLINVDTDAERLVETKFFGASSCLGAPVHGPDEDAIGALLAMHDTANAWTKAQVKAIEGFAYLTSQHIMLKASFETLRLIKQDTIRQFS